jgi:hypothetical protein
MNCQRTLRFFRRSWYVFFLLLAAEVRSTVGALGVAPPVGAFGVAPPIGARYEKSIGLPVLGLQLFSLEIISENTAHLLVKGMLILDELVTYTVSSRGCLNCRLSDKAQKKLRSFRTTLKEVGYNVATDTPYVKVRPPLPASVTIHLKRQNAHEKVDDQANDDEHTHRTGHTQHPQVEQEILSPY